MTSIKVTKIQILQQTPNEPLRKYFFDIIPDPLPQPGDFITTEGSQTYKDIRGELWGTDAENITLKIINRIFCKAEHNTWIVQLVCE